MALTTTNVHPGHLRAASRWCAMAAGLTCSIALANARPAVVTDHVVSEAQTNQAEVVFTFGQVFKDGDIPRGSVPVARVGGAPVPLQVDIKARNPDGSLRHAVLTTRVPVLRGHADEPLMLTAGSPSAAAPAVGMRELLATRYDATIALELDGKRYSVDARSLLRAAMQQAACKPWGRRCNTWLSGPLASAWVVNGPVTATDGTRNPNLQVYFAVRAYAGTTPGSVGHVRTDVIVENSWAYTPQAQLRYTATLTSGTATYTTQPLTQYAYTRWHHVLWWNGDAPDVYVRQDTQYLQASKAVSRYMRLTPDPKFLARLRQSCPPLDHCEQTKTMGNTGAQPAIGPLPRWTSLYIVDPDVRAYRWMLANTDALGAYSVHYRDAATGWPLSIRKHPYVTIANWASAHRQRASHGPDGARYRADTLPGCINNAVATHCTTSWYGTGNPDRWDGAHQPAWAYVPYMVTGDYYYMSELAFNASYNDLDSNEGYREYAKGIIGRSVGQIRGKAWVLRNLANAAWLLPDNAPLKVEFNGVVTASLAYWNKHFTDDPAANPLHILPVGAIYNVHGGQHNGIAPWQHNFLTWSVGHAAELGFPGATPFRDWLAHFEIGLMTDWVDKPTRGFCWLQAAAYNIQVKDAAGRWLPTYSAVYGTTWPSLVGLACNSPPMLAELAKVRKQPARAGEMSGYPYGATGFPSNLQIGLATAADTGLPNAHKAWAIFDSRSVKPSGTNGYQNYPNFAVVPRSAAH